MKQSERLAYWRGHIERWRDSGLSGLGYCAKAEINPSRFYKWRKRLANDDWLAVEVAPDNGGGCVRIDLGGQVQIVVEAHSSAQALRLALEALR